MSFLDLLYAHNQQQPWHSPVATSWVPPTPVAPQVAQDPTLTFLQQQLGQHQQSGPNIADFAALLNPPQRHLGMSGLELNKDGTDPGSLFNNANFHTPAAQGALYGKTGQVASSGYLPSPQTLAPGAGVNIPYANGNPLSAPGPHIDFGQIFAPRVAPMRRPQYPQV